MREDFDFTAKEGLVVKCFKWRADNPKSRPEKAAVQIVHGSLEHALRYEHAAGFLTARGFVVYACDIRGHGRSVPPGAQPNIFAQGPDGWNLSLEDVSALTDRIRRDCPHLPLFLLGHSMGSFLVRILGARRGGDYAGLLLSGTGGGNPLLIRMGLAIAGVSSLLGFRKKKNYLLHNMMYGPLNRVVKNPKTPWDFISRDTEVVKAYTEDPRCGGTATTEYIGEFLKGIITAAESRTYQNTPGELPILIFSGEDDMVAGPRGDAGEIKAVRDKYRRAGSRDLTLVIYPETRHEMFNEPNREKVMADVLSWMEARIH